MRYGKVTARQIATMANRADKAGQLGLALHLFALAAVFNEDAPLSLPVVEVTSDAIEAGHAIYEARHSAAGPSD